jgi:uncharacterized DUF497 family protein
MFVIKDLVWDQWNIAHIARHEVTKDEVEQVCQSDYQAFEAKKERLIVIGSTEASRILAVVLDPEPEEGKYYPVTARSADRKERRDYLKGKGGETNDEAA